MVLWLKNVGRAQKELGDKARFLGEMFDEVLVPHGFVLDKGFFEKFLKTTGLSDKVEKALERNDMPLVRTLVREQEMPDELKNQVYEAYKEINMSKDLEKVGEALNFIKAGQESPYVAVRVSGEKYPGYYDYSLNVKGKKSLVDAVKKCWVSAVSEEDFSVIVQKMCDAQRSGVMSTANPVNNDPSKVVVEANFGFPESVTKALSLPDYYIIDKSDGSVRKRVEEKNRCVKRDGKGEMVRVKVHEDDRNKQVLSDKDLKKLRKLAEKVESRLGKPYVVEFGIERNRVFLLQATPLHPVKMMNREAGGQVLAKGIIVSPGYAEGVVSEEGIKVVERLKSMDGPVIGEKGSILSKEAFKARKKGIPALIIPEAKSKIEEGSRVILNAYKGQISHLREEETTERREHIQPDFPRQEVSATRLQLLVRSGDYLDSRGDGFVFELSHSPYHLFAEARDHEFSQRLSQILAEAAREVDSKPLWYKSVDASEGPLLGWHGLRRNFSRVVQLELEVLKSLHHQGRKNVHYLLPFISDVNELRRVKEIARSIGLPLTMKFGVSVETPAAALNIDQFCGEGIDFVYFRPDILSQLTLGIDKELSQASDLYKPDHSSVLRQIEYALSQCRKSNVSTAVLIPGDRLDLINTFVKLGLDSVVVSSKKYQEASVEITRTERRLLLDRKRQEY